MTQAPATSLSVLMAGNEMTPALMPHDLSNRMLNVETPTTVFVCSISEI